MARAGIFPFSGTFLGPSLCHDERYSSRPDSISVGRVTNINLVNPWCLPFLDQSFAFNVELMRDRADLDVLLWPLRNKFINCNCGSIGTDCWGSFLVELFNDFLPRTPNTMVTTL